MSAGSLLEQRWEADAVRVPVGANAHALNELNGANSSTGFRMVEADGVRNAGQMWHSSKGNAGKWLDLDLLEELALSGEKHNPDDIVAITKTAENKLVWLENGTEAAGLNHIIVEHADDFENQGISQAELPVYIMETLKNGRIVGYQGKRNKRPVYEFVYKGEVRRVAITVSSNGFIVGAIPNKMEDL